jgi:SOS-response transcriptional repressor LexA
VSAPRCQCCGAMLYWQPLTKRQREVWVFLVEHYDRTGLGATWRQIRDHFSLRSYATVQEHLENLRARGYVTWRPNGRYSLRVLRRPA